MLRKALDRVETKDPPSKSDEENCSVRYRIRPSGERVGEWGIVRYLVSQRSRLHVRSTEKKKLEMRGGISGLESRAGKNDRIVFM